MSIWREQLWTERLVEVLSQVPVGDDADAFGRSFTTAPVGELDRLHPRRGDRYRSVAGCRRVGKRSSVAQYIARELSRRVARDPDFPIEGAFVEPGRPCIRYRAADGSDIVSSLTGTNWDLHVPAMTRQRTYTITSRAGASDV